MKEDKPIKITVLSKETLNGQRSTPGKAFMHLLARIASKKTDSYNFLVESDVSPCFIKKLIDREKISLVIAGFSKDKKRVLRISPYQIANHIGVPFFLIPKHSASRRLQKFTYILDLAKFKRIEFSDVLLNFTKKYEVEVEHILVQHGKKTKHSSYRKLGLGGHHKTILPPFKNSIGTIGAERLIEETSPQHTDVIGFFFNQSELPKNKILKLSEACKTPLLLLPHCSN